MAVRDESGDGGTPGPANAEVSERLSLAETFGAYAAAGAVIGPITYVLLNAAYLEFYGSLGTRPEDVGLDRLAILGRASGLTLVALLLGVFFLGLLIANYLYRSRRWRIALRRGTTARIRRLSGWSVRLLLPALTIACAGLVVLLAVVAATLSVGRRAENAEAGLPVDPLQFGPILLIDTSADAARVHWVDKDIPKPPLLEDPWLLYLGRSDRVAVFVACGTTIILPADKVVPIILTTREKRNASRGDELTRNRVCSRLRP